MKLRSILIFIVFLTSCGAENNVEVQSTDTVTLSTIKLSDSEKFRSGRLKNFLEGFDKSLRVEDILREQCYKREDIIECFRNFPDSGIESLVKETIREYPEVASASADFLQVYGEYRQYFYSLKTTVTASDAQKAVSGLQAMYPKVVAAQIRFQIEIRDLING